MTSALEQLGLKKSDFAQPANSSALSQLGLSKSDFAAPESDGITGPVSALKNIGQGFNRGLGELAAGADYAMLGFLDDTKEGQAKRPLGYLAQVLKGEQNIPGTDQRFAHEPTTRGEELLQRGGEVLNESIGPAGVIAGPARMAMRPVTSAVEQALKTLSQGSATVAGLAGETAGAIGSGVGQEIGEAATPDSAVGPVIGGLAGGLAPSALAAPGARFAARKARDTVANYVSPRASAQRARNKVAEEIGPHIEDEATQARLRKASDLREEIEGFDPDLAQATGSEALKESKRDIVRRASGSELEGIKARDAGNQQAVAGFAERNAPAGEGGADASLEPLVRDREQAAQQVRQLEERKSALPVQQAEQLGDIRSKTTQRLDQLTERERQLRPARDIVDTERQALEELTARTNGARADIAGQIRRVDRSEEGMKIRETIKAERSRRMGEINKMSKDFGIDDVDLNKPMAAFHQDIDGWQKGLLPSQQDNMPDVVRDIEALNAKAQKGKVTFQDIKSLRESANDAVLEATRDTSPGNRKRLGNAVELRRRIDGQLLNEDLIDSDGYRQFRRAYFEDIIEPFERGQVKKSTSKDGTGFYRTLDEEVGLGFLKSADAAEQLSRIAKTQPELMASVEAVALDDLASSAVANGVISPRSLERWANAHRGALQHLPGLRQQINDIVAAVGDVEGRFARGKKIIRDRKLTEQNRLAREKQDIARQRQDVRRVAADETQRIKAETAGAQERLQSAMQPLLERMGAHNERRMALEDTQLARRLAGIAKGSTTPAAVIDQAMQKPELMKRLWSATVTHTDARAALRRHVWDGVSSLDGASIRQYMEANETSLNIVLGKPHLDKLRIIAEAREMADFAPATGSAKPISTNLNEKIRETTGLNVSAIAATGAAVSRGRSSKTVEGLRVLFQVLTERGRQGYERLMREALFNPEVARSLIESAQFANLKPQSTRLEDFASRRLRAWLWTLGISSATDAKGDRHD